MYFSATIFALVGFRSPVLTSLSVALTNFIFTLVAFHAIDRVGRRRILLYSIPVMILGLALCSVAFSFVKLPKHGEEGALIRGLARRLFSERAEEDGQGAGGKEWPGVIVAAMVLYVSGYAVGLGCVPWQQSE
jgi:MFS transporter, SP family, solute carrier family 2 (myo-inositol transporter), member 13